MKSSAISKVGQSLMPDTYTYADYQERMRRIADIRYASALLQWDQETYLPVKGHEHRSRQIATLTELAHDLFTSSETGKILDALMRRHELTDTHKRNIQLSRYDYDKSRKLSPAFVRGQTEAVNKGFHAWLQARQQNDFGIFAPALQEVVRLKREEAEWLGYAEHPYDALLNEYDRGMTVRQLDHLFAGLRVDLSRLMAQISKQPAIPRDFLHKHYPKDAQWSYGLYLLAQMGFDFEAGRQDLSEHPFTVNFNRLDVRVTTRIDEHDFANMAWSCLHEGGHALYEQGLPDEAYGLPLGEYCSLSIHESQSRLWENAIGRGRAFWKQQYPYLQTVFPVQLKDVSLESFYRAINTVQPSLIRTEADELTYHFHVMIRYEIEKGLIEGSIAVDDIPAVWNRLYKEYLGLDIPDDRSGCLQDVHWGHGSFGYFSTYSTGSLYAAQFYHSMLQARPSLAETTGPEDIAWIREWLAQHIYRFGRYYTAGELCQRVTDETLNSRYFIDYATQKFSDIYGIQIQ